PRRRARLAGVELAMGRALEPLVHDRAMSRAPKTRRVPVSTQGPELAAGGEPKSRVAALAAPTAAKEPKRRRRATAGFEQSIGYRFKDAELLEQALTHISAITGLRNRAGSYQRLEFLGDH